jgi:hypothetical protein
MKPKRWRPTCYSGLTQPPAHQQYNDGSPERFLRWAEDIGPHTVQLIAAVLDARQHPQQAYRSCLGILGLAKRYSNARLEAACRRALPAGIRFYLWPGMKTIFWNGAAGRNTVVAFRHWTRR